MGRPWSHPGLGWSSGGYRRRRDKGSGQPLAGVRDLDDLGVGHPDLEHLDRRPDRRFQGGPHRAGGDLGGAGHRRPRGGEPGAAPPARAARAPASDPASPSGADASPRSMAHTRAYRDGQLVAEGFPVADVSEHLAEPGTIVWVDLCRPSAEQLNELRDELGFHELAVEDALERPPAAQARPLPEPPLPVVPCRPPRPGDRRAGHDRGGRVRQRAVAHHGPQGRRLPHRTVARALEPQPRPRRPWRAASCSTGCSTWSSTATSTPSQQFDEFYDGSARASSPSTRSNRPSSGTGSRCARRSVRFHRLVVPMREVVSSLMRREHGGVDSEM